MLSPVHQERGWEEERGWGSDEFALWRRGSVARTGACCCLVGSVPAAGSNPPEEERFSWASSTTAKKKKKEKQILRVVRHTEQSEKSSRLGRRWTWLHCGGTPAVVIFIISSACFQRENTLQKNKVQIISSLRFKHFVKAFTLLKYTYMVRLYF